ncbi:endonuclease/exonuclease/phosphatase family protein [Geminicoccus roseus]|uniref:endonuclease/exonuclease/phosphatase family protein n=1 Tax=Geminicoccus roseus TaxID=404900 RepID=UPI00040D39C9|nr:endonuclease/exonuclease/phosphatase family protein [Geminicoccus roseus]
MRERHAGRLPSHILSILQQERITYRAEHAAGTGTLIASYNVHKCVGMDNRFDPGRTAAVIGEIHADVIALQEADQRFGERSGLLDLAQLERSCGLLPVPVRGSAKGHGWHGNVLLVRQGTVRDVHQISLPGVEPRGALVVDLDLAAGPLRIIAAHLGLLRRSRARQAEAILAAMESRAERPTLLMGDLNEWRLGQRSSLLRLDPSFGPLAPALPSFPSRFPIFALDRILANPARLISSIEVHDTRLARMASDHLPVKARIDLEASAPHLPADDAAIAA